MVSDPDIERIAEGPIPFRKTPRGGKRLCHVCRSQRLEDYYQQSYFVHIYFVYYFCSFLSPVISTEKNSPPLCESLIN